jgi:hypothetical protein
VRIDLRIPAGLKTAVRVCRMVRPRGGRLFFYQTRFTTENTKYTKEINSYANHQSTIFDQRFLLRVLGAFVVKSKNARKFN